MTKTKATVWLCILLVVVLFFGVFTFLPEVKMGSYTYNSPINLVGKSNELAKSIETEFTFERPEDMSDEDYSAAIAATAKVMEARLSSYYIDNAQIIAGNEKITLVLPTNSYDSNFYKAMTQKGVFEISTKTDNKYTAIINNSQFDKVYATYSGSSYYVIMDMNAEAKAAISQLTEKAEETNVTIYFRLDGEDYTSTTLKTQYTDDSLYISTTSANEAQLLLTVLNNGVYGFKVTQGSVYAISGKANTNALTWIYIALAILVLTAIVGFIVCYGLGGIAASLAIIADITVIVLADTFVYGGLSIGGFIGLFVSLAFFVLFNVLLLEKYKASANADREPDLEKRMNASLNKAYAAYTKPMLLTAVLGLIASCSIWAAATGSIRPFGVMLTYGLIFGVLATLFVTKVFARFFNTLCKCPKCHRVNKEENAND